jgi:hypothetical protein
LNKNEIYKKIENQICGFKTGRKMALQCLSGENDKSKAGLPNSF